MVDSEEVGVKVADSEADPSETGTQSHVAVADAIAIAPQPEIVVPPNMKFTVPARDVVAVIRFVMRYCGDKSAIEILTVVEAYPTEIVKLDVVAVAPFASVTVIDTIEEPATVGIPEIVPVEVAKLRPFTNVPVNAYVNEARPPAPRTAREKGLFAVPDKPVVGAAIVNTFATVNIATDDVIGVEEIDEPLLIEFVMTTV